MNRCIVCYNCETNLPFYEEACLEFLTNACWQIFLQTQLSNFFSPKTADGTVCPFKLSRRLFTFSGNTADQHEWGTGEFLSYYIFNHSDVFTKRLYSEIHNKCCKVLNMIA